MSETRRLKKTERNLQKGIKVAKRDQRKMARADRRHEIRCFWTWPFGHAFREVQGGKRCVACAKPVAVSSPVRASTAPVG